MTNLVRIVPVLCLFLFACQNDEKKLTHLVAQANQQKEKDPSGALKLLNKAIGIDSNFVPAHILKGEILNYQTKYFDALAEFSKAQLLDHDNTRTLFDLGITWSLLDRDDSAIIFYNKAIRAKTSNSTYVDLPDPELLPGFFNSDVLMSVIRYFRGKSYYQTQKYGDALEDFKFSAEKHYKTDQCFLYIGVIYLDAKNNNLGCEYLNRAFENGNLEAKNYISKYCK